MWYHPRFRYAETTKGQIMASKRPEKKVTETEEVQVTKHARIELPESDYSRLKACADRLRISVAAYIRMSVMERIGKDEGK